VRILYLSQYFPPEVGATQTRAYEMARHLVLAGHRVTMLTEVPNHPEGIIRPEYRDCFWVRETLDGIDVIRVWVKTSPIKTTRTRLAFYLSYMLNATLIGLVLARGRYDIIYATSPPLFVGGAALILSYLRRTPLVFEVRDLWPESAVALGELTNPRLIRWATWLEEICYRKAQRVVVTAQEMVDHLVERGFRRNKTVVIRNGSNTDLFRFDAKARQQYRQVLEIDDKFVIVYAGLLGIAQGLHAVIDAARLLMSQEPQIHFLLIGSGPEKESLQQYASEMKLTNLTFLSAQPRESIPAYLSAGDVALIPLTRKRLLGALPSKMFDAMACQRPIILSAEGEAKQILDRAEAGLFAEPENASTIAAAILQLKEAPELCVQMGINGRLMVERHYSRQALAGQLVKLLEGLIENSS
jgi:colanic acid biosynthesis glycosyl transferase WcaI